MWRVLSNGKPQSVGIPNPGAVGQEASAGVVNLGRG